MSKSSSPSPLLIQPIIDNALREDFGHHGDITSRSIIPQTTQANALMRTRQSGKIAGLDIAAQVFHTVDPTLCVGLTATDGMQVEAGECLMEISGTARSILMGERVAINLLSHLSGIASATANMVAGCAGTHAAIADTRKTTPGLRILEKYAVRMGGGVNHRFGLDDAFLIKDNHVAVAGGVTEALDAAQFHAGHMVKIEIEVDTMAQLDSVIAHGGADIVMLDNFSLEDAKIAVQKVKQQMMVEFSGTVTVERIPEIAQTGVDIISSGWLTHSSPALDIGLDINI